MKILNNLTIKHLKANKKRTIVTIIGIILSTALMVGIGLLFSTVRDNSVKMIIDNNGDHHVAIEVEKNKLDFISKNDSVSKYKYKSSLGYSLYEGITNEYKPYINVLTASKEYLEDLKLIEGRLPNNENEIIISEHLETNGEVKLNVGDKIKLNIGDRISKEGILLGDSPYAFEYTCDENNVCTENVDEKTESLINTKEKEYTIVGIIKRDILEDYSNPGYSAFTVSEPSEMLMVYVNYKNVKDTYKNSQIIAQNLGYKHVNDSNYYHEVNYNDNLLAFSGVSNYSNMIDSMAWVIIIILSLVSIACIIVIYNSFAISVMERKKQFGLFSSIGATQKQLRHTVFFEAFIVGIIGIPLGVASAYLGIGIVLMIVNKLLPNMFDFPLALATYPLFIIIPIIFMIITILVSAFLPARSASKVSPIEAIRLNDDIKIKSKKLKTPRIIKLFGVEGEIAYKNMKRNKKKYRITIISLFISIVLFVSFSSLLKYGLTSAYDFTELPKYEYAASFSSDKKESIDSIINQVLKIDGIKKYSVYNQTNFLTDNNDYFNKEVLDMENTTNDRISVNVLSLDNKSYEEYKKQIGLSTDQPILLNTYSYIEYTNNSRKQITVTPYNKISSLEIKTYDEKNNFKLDNIYSTNILPFGIEETYLGIMTIIVNEETYNKLKIDDNYYSSMYLLADNYDEFDKLLDSESKENILTDDVSVYTINIKKELQLLSNIVFVIKLLLYGFISLVTLIGVTSVINTINTSIALRKKEFAVLRSIGLTPRGFNKMMLFECLFFGLKSLLYGLPVSFIVIYLFHLSFNGIVSFDSLLIPYGSILIAIFGVFIIVLISMWYATIRIKKDNILDAIREENI